MKIRTLNMLWRLGSRLWIVASALGRVALWLGIVAGACALLGLAGWAVHVTVGSGGVVGLMVFLGTLLAVIVGRLTAENSGRALLRATKDLDQHMSGILTGGARDDMPGLNSRERAIAARRRSA